jgi:hypothetical protein
VAQAGVVADRLALGPKAAGQRRGGKWRAQAGVRAGFGGSMHS